MKNQAGWNRGSGTEGQCKAASYKRPFDLAILIVAHLILAPVWLLIWVLIPLAIWIGDRGPIFYGQVRIGCRGRTFVARKFRTMVVNADAVGRPWTVERDPRITRVGRVLRKTALDELPQVLSIWRGDLSLVGPRALDVREHSVLEASIPGFSRRLTVLPGLTGLAQVYDRTDDAATKLRLDLEYAQKMNPVLDLRLIALSLVNSVAGRWDRRSGKAALIGDRASGRSVQEEEPRNPPK